MKKCEIRVVTPMGRDATALTQTLCGLGYPLAAEEFGDGIVVVDARDSGAAEWAEIERDLRLDDGPAVVISDGHDPHAMTLGQRVGRQIVFASGESALGYNLAIKLCTLLMEEQASQAVAA